MSENIPHEERRQPGRDIPLAEWAAAAVGLMIVLAALALLVIEAVRGSGSPPDIQVSVLAVESQENTYLVRFRITNRGGSTAAQLVIEGALTLQDGVTERRQVTLDYVPARSMRGGGLFFTSDPSKGHFGVRAIGYQEP
jgi:uncharacterized protein (TIGR02588 family)